MTTVGPVCHIPPTTKIDQPGPVNLPSIPSPQPNMASVVNTLNQIRTVINYITGRQGPRGAQGAPGAAAKSKPSRWSESGRTTEKVKIYQNNDPSTGNFVEVERINELKMKDAVTGETWDWKR